MEPIFRVDGNRVVTSPDAAGPWDPRMQHGSAPAALVVWAAEAMPTPVPMQIARVTIDLMRPVPVAPLTIETEVLARGPQDPALRRPAAAPDGVVVVSATVLKIKTQTAGVAAGGRRSAGRTSRSRSIASSSRRISPRSPFTKCISMRAARGRFGMVGPAAIWYRVDRPLVEGSPVSQAMRAVVAADFSNGTSPALDFRQWTFINADLTVSFARQPVGEWILLDGEILDRP